MKRAVEDRKEVAMYGTKAGKLIYQMNFQIPRNVK